ncbi:hypothetical protein, partial [Streptomyces sp. PT12]|uniref:hypothetical protein n=1 Tax=Streptomyces sp. PT12 TaxID=1510197 RepID=UPI000E055082
DYFSDTGRLPFAWSGVSLTAEGATSLRVRVAAAGGSDAVTLTLADTTGAPVATVESLVLRQFQPGALRTGHHESLFQVTWTPHPLPEAATPVEGTEIVVAGAAEDGTVIPDTHAEVVRVVGLLGVERSGP